MTVTSRGHDLIVIGASAGGLEALRILVAQLSSDLPAAVLVVLHRLAQAPNLLPEILARAGPLPAIEAADHLPIRPGAIFVAPPDRHLIVNAEGSMRLVHGPKENHSRPAIDPLFRSAAWAYGPRVIGVLLSGMLNDGSAGLWAIKTCGGSTVIQDPADALYPDMPEYARQHVEIDACVPVARMGEVLSRLVAEPAASPASFTIPDELKLETEMVQMEKHGASEMEKIGTLSAFTCPSCHGTLWEINGQPVLRYRCHTGHAFTVESLAAEQSQSIEEALYVAMRALEENARISRRVAERSRASQLIRSAELFEEKTRECEANAQLIRDLLAKTRATDSPHGSIAPRGAPTAESRLSS